MKIHRVRLAGFRGVQQPLEVPCGRGFTVICGNNGAGKSTICDAIEFVLSGSLGFHVGSERGEYISNYIWWRGPAAREHYAAVDISDPEGDVFTVQRTRRHSSGEQWLPRLIDSHSAPNDWRSELCLTSILRDESITTLSTDIPERERYDFALRAIGLANSVVVETGIASVIADLESRRSEAIKIYEAERDKVESFTAELSQACISATKASKKSLERIRLAYAQSLKDQLDLSGLGELIAQKLAQLRSRLNSLERWRDGKEALEKHRTETATVEFQRMVKRRESEWQSLQASFAKVQQSYEAISAQLRNEQTRSPLVTSLANLKEHGQRVGMRNGKCPLCGSQISQGDFDNHLSELEREIKQVSDGVAAAVHAERETRATMDQLRQQLQMAESEYKRLQATADELASEEGKLNDAAKQLGIDPDGGSIAKEIEKSGREIASLNEDMAVVEAYASIHRVTELEEFLRGTQNIAEQAEKNLRTISRAVDSAIEIRAAANRVSGEIVRERLSALKPLFLELYERLRPHAEWSEIDFLLRGDVRPFLSFVVGQDMNPRFVFSSGQRRALGMAFLLAIHLGRTWCKLETLVLDDPIQHVDDYRALHLVETLSAMRMSGRQIICTAEDPVLADLWCRRLRSRAGSEGLRIELENIPGQGVRVKEIREIAPITERALAAD